MKSNFLSKISILGLFILFFGGCETVISTLAGNNTVRKPTPTDSESKDFKIEGCSIPLPLEKTKFETRDEYLKDVNGKQTKIIRTIYHPIGEFVFTPGKRVMMQYPYTIIYRGETNPITFRLIRLHELRVKDKIFGYSFIGQEVLSQEVIDAAKPYNAAYSGLFGFTCFDFTGDGNFEYIADDGKFSDVVPEWATR